MPEPQFATAVLPVSPTLSLHFRATMLQERRKSEGFEYNALLYLYERRIDEENMPFLLPTCLENSRNFHACITTSSKIIAAANAKHFVYEGQQDVVLNPRAVIQNTARWYDVDPSEMMAQYKACRPYLAHRLLPAPDSIEAVLLRQEQRGNANVKGYN